MKILKIGSVECYSPTDAHHDCDFCGKKTYFRDETNRIKEKNDIIMCSECVKELFSAMGTGLADFKKKYNL